MKNLANQFFEIADLYPNKIAVWCENESITYNNLANLISQYSNYLLDNGVTYRDHIGIPMNNSIESVALILTAANLGVGLVPINPTLPLDAIKTAFDSSDVKHLIARRVFFEQYDKLGELNLNGMKFCLDGKYEGAIPFTDAMNMSIKRPINEEIGGDETLIITMTSGSTGSPKPIDLTQNNKYQRAMAHISLYNITKDDIVLAATPLYHSLAERLVLIPLLIGGTSVLLPRFTADIWLNCIKEKKVTFTIAVSAQLSQIAELLSTSSISKIDSLRSVVSSSSLLESHVKNKLIEKLKCDFHEMYGTSEISTATSINFKESLNHDQSVGRPLPEAYIRIIKDNGELAPTHEIGEIACKTKLMCNGYYGMQEAFNNALQNGYFKTGDMGYLDKDGFLYFSGRKKELIITGGINVYPSDLEKYVLELPEVEECAAFAYPDERLGEVVALAVVNKQNCKLNKRSIRIQCARNLADFQQPHKIFFVNELPKNAMGKLVKFKLMEYIKLNCLNE
ncbi:class I adenylate-forming enzyme family protein [Selenihalanaerobacter shriftii]|uniref:Long-chain acyl-CoA synthetase n=1 Tax=Selenihalanaerobacter shriftii TaxID=142842 RepID=A0A1T4KMS8_9FIRM|nr:class I adenylate-forming enzyme family protein [Selenihalanaerobacter shriftii]SJZ43689.1 long-chain acyl-CoA synthetase [Selenihalanaerobacter shriftii]